MRTFSKWLVGALVAASLGWSMTAMAATEAEKLAAIQNGLSYLAATQLADGSWSYGGYEQAATGAAAFAFLSQKTNWGTNSAKYQTVVDNAIGYLVTNASTMAVSIRNDGVNICPGGAASCVGVYWYGAGESTYTTGLVAPAIALYGKDKGASAVATTSGALANMTWGQIAQGITNEFAASQSSTLNGNRDGGWRYYIPGNGDSDSSTTQWAVISLIYDQTLGAITPTTVVDHLKSWLAVAQVAGQGGAGCYQPDYLICEQSDTGSLLIGLKFVGDDLSNSQVLTALGYLNTNWTQTANNTWYGNFGQPYAMWSEYKALETTVGLNDTTYITSRLTDCGVGRGATPGSGVCNWWEDFNEWLKLNQGADGSWAGYAYWTNPLSTAFYINILGATMIPEITAPCLAISAAQGSPLSPVTMQATGGSGGPYTYSATGLPAGLTMSLTGTISGTPTLAGSYDYTVTIHDSAGNQGTVKCTIVVLPPITAPCPSITATQGTAITPATVVATGGAGGPFTFAATGLPAGLSISSTGVISGTPTVSGTFNYTVTITDAAGNTGTLQCAITVASSVTQCPVTRDYWEDHPGVWPVTSLVLGKQTYNQMQLLRILRSWDGFDASMVLAGELIAAKLNVANGADPTPIAATINKADALLSGYTGNLPYHVMIFSAQGKAMMQLEWTLDLYNYRFLTPKCSWLRCNR